MDQITENTIKILKKLDNNIDKYQVAVQKTHYLADHFTIEFFYNGIRCQLTIASGGRIEFYHRYMSIETTVDEQYRYEILHLAQKLYDQSQEYILNAMSEFAQE